MEFSPSKYPQRQTLSTIRPQLRRDSQPPIKDTSPLLQALQTKKETFAYPRGEPHKTNSFELGGAQARLFEKPGAKINVGAGHSRFFSGHATIVGSSPLRNSVLRLEHSSVAAAVAAASMELSRHHRVSPVPRVEEHKSKHVHDTGDVVNCPLSKSLKQRIQKNNKGTTIKLIGDSAFQSLSTKEFTLSPGKRKKEPSRKPFQIAFLVSRKSTNIGAIFRKNFNDSPAPQQTQ